MNQLPIDVIPGTYPPKFRWEHIINTPVGTRILSNEATLPPSVENAIVQLITITKQQISTIELLKTDLLAANDKTLELQRQIDEYTERLTAQLEPTLKTETKPSGSFSLKGRK